VPRHFSLPDPISLLYSLIKPNRYPLEALSVILQTAFKSFGRDVIGNFLPAAPGFFE
jgi:hypothetical protein